MRDPSFGKATKVKSNYLIIITINLLHYLNDFENSLILQVVLQHLRDLRLDSTEESCRRPT